MKTIKPIKIALIRDANRFRGLSGDHQFNPLTILGDLIRKTKGQFFSDIKEILAYDFNSSFKIQCPENEVEEYFNKMQDLRNLIFTDYALSISDFERLRYYYGLSFQMDFLDSYSESGFDPLVFGFCTTKKVLEKIDSKYNAAIYQCYSMIDIPFSILHFLLINGYTKFKDCEYCGRLFATSSLKTKYCDRQIVSGTFPSMECAMIVDHTLKMAKKRKHSITTYLQNNYPKAVPLFYDQFDEYAGKNVIKSIDALNELRRITNKEYVRDTWYKEEYK